MTAIELKCVICGELFWSSGFDHICYMCACKQEPKAWDLKQKQLEIIEDKSQWTIITKQDLMLLEKKERESNE